MTPLLESDYDEVLEMFHEPETFKYIKPLAGKKDEWYRQFLDSKRRVIEEGKGYYWVVRVLETGVYIGSANLYAFRDTDMIQLGCQLKRDCWSHGYAGELMAKVLEYAVGDFGLSEVFGFFQPENVASRMILKRLGFSYLKMLLVDNETIEVHHFVKP